MTTAKRHTAPRHLSPAMRAWWRDVLTLFEIAEPHHLRILEAAATTWDRAVGAREVVEQQGAVMTDRFGQAKEHPAVSIERQSLLAFARLCRELGLDLDEPAAPRLPTKWRD